MVILFLCRQAGCILYTLLAGFPPFHADEKADADIKAGKYWPMDGAAWKNPSEDAKDLVRKMLTKDPKKRIDMNGILSHPWLSPVSHGTNDESPDMDEDYKARIKGLVLRQKLKRYFVTNNILQNHRGNILTSREAAQFYFSDFDRDGNGLIGLEEMVRIVYYNIDPRSINS